MRVCAFFADHDSLTWSCERWVCIARKGIGSLAEPSRVLSLTQVGVGVTEEFDSDTAAFCGKTGLSWAMKEPSTSSGTLERSFASSEPLGERMMIVLPECSLATCRRPRIYGVPRLRCKAARTLLLFRRSLDTTALSDAIELVRAAPVLSISRTLLVPLRLNPRVLVLFLAGLIIGMFENRPRRVSNVMLQKG